ncbi:hypothetical protein PybrP1_007016, partial [[Pythium] brassicae (nom. inval.)]
SAQILPGEIPFSLTIKIGEVGHTTRKILAGSKFGFHVADGFEAFRAMANARTTQELQRIAEMSSNLFIHSDHSVYFRPRDRTKQSDLVALTAQNFLPRITRMYNKFIVRKATDAAAQFDCRIVTFVKEDTSRSEHREPPPATALARPPLQPPSPAASVNQAFQEWYQQRQYSIPLHPPAIVAMDTPVMVMPPSLAAGPPPAPTPVLAAGPPPAPASMLAAAPPPSLVVAAAPPPSLAAAATPPPPLAIGAAGRVGRSPPPPPPPPLPVAQPQHQQKRKRSQTAAMQQSTTPRADSVRSEPDDRAYKSIRMVLNGQVVPVKVNVRDLLACAEWINQAAGSARGKDAEGDSDDHDDHDDHDD